MPHQVDHWRLGRWPTFRDHRADLDIETKSRLGGVRADGSDPAYDDEPDDFGVQYLWAFLDTIEGGAGALTLPPVVFHGQQIAGGSLTSRTSVLETDGAPLGAWSHIHPFGRAEVVGDHVMRDADYLDTRYREWGDAGKQPDPSQHDWRDPLDRPVAGGTPMLMVAGAEEHAQRNLAFPFHQLISDWRGASAAKYSTPAFDVRSESVDWDRGGGLHTHMRLCQQVEHKCLGFAPDFAWAWNLTQHPEDNLGLGLYIAPGDGGAVPPDPFQGLQTGQAFSANVPVQQQQQPLSTHFGRPGADTLALTSWANDAWGPFHPGHALHDKHKYGVNDDEHMALNSGHLWTNAYWYQDAVRDGPFLFEGDYPGATRSRVPREVHLTWDGSLPHQWCQPRYGKWRWYTTVDWDESVPPPPYVPDAPGLPPGVPTEVPGPNDRIPPGLLPPIPPEIVHLGIGPGPPPIITGEPEIDRQSRVGAPETQITPCTNPDEVAMPSWYGIAVGYQDTPRTGRFGQNRVVEALADLETFEPPLVAHFQAVGRLNGDSVSQHHTTERGELFGRATGDGGLWFTPPEVAVDDDDYSPTTRSTTSLMLHQRVAFGWGSPLAAARELAVPFASGPRWMHDPDSGLGALALQAYDASGVAIAVGDANDIAYTIHGSVKVGDALTVSGLTAGRVVYTGASGLLSAEAAFAYDATNDQLQLSTPGSGAGILLGAEQWYGDGAGVMRTPDALTVDGDVVVGSGSSRITVLGGGVRSEQFGALADAQSNDSTSLGYDATCSAIRTLSLGALTDATATGCIAGGYGAQCGTSAYGLALGVSANSQCASLGGVAIGYSADAITGVATFALGYASLASGTYSIAMGYATVASGAGAVAMGYHSDATSSYAFALGYNAQASGGSYVTAMGYSANASAAAAFALGGATTAGYAYSIAFGYHADTTAANQLVIGSVQGPITAAYLGEGVTSATPQDLTINATGGSGTNIAAGDLIFAVGRSTGNADPGRMVFQTTVPGASGSALQTLSDALVLDGDHVDTTGGRRLQLDTISASTTLTSAHHVVHVDTAGGAVTVTLPSASANPGQTYVIKHGNSGFASGFTCTLSSSGSDRIDATLTTLGVAWGTTTTVISDGTSVWRVLGSSY